VKAKPKLLVAGIIVAVLALLWAAHGVMTGIVLDEGRARADSTLRLTAQALDGHLRRYQAIPDLLGEDPGIRRLVGRPDDPRLVAAMNGWLEHRNAIIAASEIYVMDASGVTIASSNHGESDSFVGQDFSYRPYFTDAIAGRAGRFFAIGTTSGIRGFYFSSPVRDEAGDVRGVVAVKVDLDAIEAEWRRQEDVILVTDPDGIVFLSTDPGLLYRSAVPLSDDLIARVAATRRYADRDLAELSIVDRREQGVALVTLGAEADTARGYVVARRLMPLADWTVHVLLDEAPLRAQALLGTLAVGLAIAVALSGIYTVRQRRVRLAERIALQERAKVELEHRVEERTADLARVNARIAEEIAERRAAESELRRTQADLIQAGKLAALGQMSAALSHEINQPLAAARNYADSAAVLIERGQTGRARENLDHILQLIDRMAAISRHLRNVARKPDEPLTDLDVEAAVADALDVARPRLTAAGAAVSVDVPHGLPPVKGVSIRLQQVLINVLSNAADAAEETGDPRIEVTAREAGPEIYLTVRDHGPGVPAAIADRIFDPFFTTKRVGSGLGLGLSISYNILRDFGGDLRVARAEGGGAAFTLVLASARVRKAT
jgi:two-component system C4-dicarboxylate transport sensor histidine kinase DctB